jgi:tRNA-splicing endonuclease subunit Sen54
MVPDETSNEIEDIQGAPMSVQQAYSEMIGTEGLTLEKYQVIKYWCSPSDVSIRGRQVFAHLKRLGYVVTRTDPPSSAYPTPPPFSNVTQRRPIFHRLYSVVSRWISKIFSPLLTSFDWWRPLRHRSCFQRVNRYGKFGGPHDRERNTDTFEASLFRSLRFIPSTQKISLPTPMTSSPYRIFFNVYKPSTSFRKTAPPPPDFFVVVIK